MAESGAKPCPICGKQPQDAAAAQKYRPFCSKRCADIDLHHWLNGSYAIPAVEADDDGPEGLEAGDEAGGVSDVEARARKSSTLH